MIRNFFRDMVDMGIDVVLESNDFDAPYKEPAAEKPEPTAEKPAPAEAAAADPAGKEAL